MNRLRRRLLWWLMLRFGRDMTIVQNVDIGGCVHVPSDASLVILRGNRISGSVVYIPDGTLPPASYRLEA